MTLLKPCVECGEISQQNRCPDHRPRRPTRTGPRRTARWEQLSKWARRQQPFCAECGRTDDLTADHIVPVTVRPDWTLEKHNLIVLCRRHNSMKGTEYDPTEIDRIETLILKRKRRVQSANREPGDPTQGDRGHGLSTKAPPARHSAEWTQK